MCLDARVCTYVKSIFAHCRREKSRGQEAEGEGRQGGQGASGAEAEGPSEGEGGRHQGQGQGLQGQADQGMISYVGSHRPPRALALRRRLEIPAALRCCKRNQQRFGRMYEAGN